MDESGKQVRVASSHSKPLPAGNPGSSHSLLCCCFTPRHRGRVVVLSLVINPPDTVLSLVEIIVLLRQLSYAIKTQL